jgi:FkbM family methyltransferase
MHFAISPRKNILTKPVPRADQPASEPVPRADQPTAKPVPRAEQPASEPVPRGDQPTAELPTQPQQFASSLERSSSSDDKCPAPFYSTERVSSMIAAANPSVWKKDFPFWDRWKNYFEGKEEFYMRDDPNGRDHFSFLATFLDATTPGLLVDVGANEGGFMRFAALRGYAAIGIDPLSRNTKLLRDKVFEHGIYKHANIIHAALWSEAGQLFELDENKNIGQLLASSTGLAPPESKFLITSTTLDHVIRVLLEAGCGRLRGPRHRRRAVPAAYVTSFHQCCYVTSFLAQASTMSSIYSSSSPPPP